MRFKLAFASVFTIAAAPAVAHTGHGFEMPRLLHILTNADHLSIALGVGVLVAIAGGIVFSRSRK